MTTVDPTTADEFQTQAARAGTWEGAASGAAIYLVEVGESGETPSCTPQARSVRSVLDHHHTTEALGMIVGAALRELARLGWNVEDGEEFIDWYVLPLLADKQHDYGHDNINLTGEEGLRVRILDKWARYENLRRRSASSPSAETDGAIHESTSDTLVDIIGYCTLWQMLQDGTFDLPLGRDTADLSAGAGTAYEDVFNYAQAPSVPASEPASNPVAPSTRDWDSAVLGAAEKALAGVRQRAAAGETIGKNLAVAFQHQDELTSVWLRLDVAP